MFDASLFRPTQAITHTAVGFASRVSPDQGEPMPLWFSNIAKLLTTSSHGAALSAWFLSPSGKGLLLCTLGWWSFVCCS